MQQDEPAWARAVDIVTRWHRFVVLGVAICWALLIAVALLLPGKVECEATLSLPSNPAQVEEPAPAEGTPPPAREWEEGITVAAYKRIEASLADRQLLRLGLSELGERELVLLGTAIKGHLSPVMTGSRNEVERVAKDDRVTAIRLSYVSSSPDRARLVVDGLARLVGGVLLTDNACARIEMELAKEHDASTKAAARKAELAFSNQSLKLLESDLSRLGGGAAELGSRQVVDVGQEGYRYLPPAVQLVGVKAKRAENDHRMRLATRTLERGAVRIDLYTRLEAGLRREFVKNNAFVAFDSPAVLQQGFEQFERERSGAIPEDVRLEFRMFRDALLLQRSNLQLIEHPTARRRSRAPLFLVAALLAAGAVVTAAFAGESWQRFHTRPTLPEA